MKTAFLLAGFVLALSVPRVQCDTGGAWPKSFTSDGASLTVYQPQVTGWSGNTLTARVAVSVLPEGAAAPQFGTLVLTGTADVDNEQQTVSLSNIAPVQASFPSAPDQADNYAGLVCSQAIGWAQNLSLPAVRANLAVTKAEGAPTVPVQNPVPVIFFSETSAALVLVNGDPALRPVAGTSLLRAINTRAVLVMDQSSGLYYLRVSGGWSQAPSLAGPWTAAQNPPSTLSTVLQNISSTAELFNPPEGSKPGPPPAIYVSTGPAELITTQGTPQFAPIAGTGLLKVTNSGSSIFVYEPNQNYYVVISGRWFASPSLAGPWQFVPSAQLPADFSKIPESDPAGAVLASVAGTPQAGEAAISSTIPQTATIARTATTTVSYAGDPVFQPVGGTSLSYAVNTPTPVIQVAEDAFYSVVNGVWFLASAALGPWTVAASVPDVIYTIPPSCPVYYATNVHVYGSTPDVIFTGYTPGYFGPCLSPDGVVVYGTGFWYPPFIGPTIWIGPPLTYGFGAGFACGLATGFAFGLAADHGWGCSPWWGPWHGGWGNSVTVNRKWNNVNVNAHNVYNRWPDNVVKNPGSTINRANVDNTVRNDANTVRANNDLKPEADTIRSNPDYQNWKNNADNRVKDESTRLGDNNVFAGRDGNAYRCPDDGNWERRDGNTWSRPDASSFDSGIHSDLDSQRFSRSVGGMRSFGGGGMRGGFRR